jgi:hypothetical protein
MDDALKRHLEEHGLQAGPHNSRKHGICFMEAVAWLAGERHSDRPACASTAIGFYARRLNDYGWDSDKERAEWLMPLAHMVVGTADSLASQQSQALFLFQTAVQSVTGRLSGFQHLRDLPSISIDSMLLWDTSIRYLRPGMPCTKRQLLLQQLWGTMPYLYSLVGMPPAGYRTGVGTGTVAQSAAEVIVASCQLQPDEEKNFMRIGVNILRAALTRFHPNRFPLTPGA